MGPDTVSGIHRRLAAGRLGFRVRSSAIKGARREWIAAGSHHPIDRTAPVDQQHLLQWADSRPRDDLDPSLGPGWRLSTAELNGGGCVLMVTCSHALIDGRGLIRLLAEHVPLNAESLRPRQASPDAASDADDALRQWAIVGLGSLRAVGGLLISRRRRRELRRYRAAQRRPHGAPDHDTRPAATPSGEPVWQIVEIDRAGWDSRADSDGGTPNSAFVRAAGRLAAAIAGRDHVTVGVAVDTRDRSRTADGDRANAVAMAAVAVGRMDDHAPVRDRCRDAYAGALAAPAGFPAELVQVLPDAIVDRMVPAPGRYDALCSNLGEAPNGLGRIDAVPARSTAGRALGPTGEFAALFVLGIGERYCVAVMARPGTSKATLTTLIDAELGPILRRW